MIYFFFLFFGCFLGAAHALQTRSGDTTDNNRHDEIQLSSQYAYQAQDFSGVGWYLPDSRRQFALVSPRHFVCATHFRPAVGGQVRFIGTDGVISTHTIAQVEIVQDGGNTDLSLGTLSTGVNPGVIRPVKFANISSFEVSGAAGLAFGFPFLTGETTLSAVIPKGGLSGPKLDAAIQNSRIVQASYSIAAGGDNEVYAEEGDSGSPLFFRSGTRLGVIGVNSAIGSNPGTRFLYAAYIPEYISQLDAFMNDEGYQMSEMDSNSFFPPPTLTVTKSEPVVLRQGRAGHILLNVENEERSWFSTEGSNLTLTIQNADRLPATLSGPGLYPGLVTSQSKEAHAASLPAGAIQSKTLRLDWSALPVSPNLQFDLLYRVDETTLQTQRVTLDLLEGYLSFVDGVADQSVEGDPDSDAVSNLLEYALGGDPMVTSQSTSEGSPLLPFVSSGRSAFEFLRRTDAATRGLSYVVEYSDTLQADSWRILPQDDETTRPAAEAGFEHVRIPLDGTLPKRFYRLKVDLTE